MAKPNMEPKPVRVSITDIRIMIAVGICVLTSTLLNHFGIKLSYGEMKLEIIQKITAAISCLLVTQDGMGASKGAGIVRIKVTVMAGIAALVIVLIDTAIGNEWVSVLLVMVGLVLTLVLCKAVKAPYMNCRIGGVNFIIMSCTLTANARLAYTGMRIVSTIYGVLVVLLVTWIFEKFSNKDK